MLCGTWKLHEMFQFRHSCMELTGIQPHVFTAMPSVGTVRHSGGAEQLPHRLFDLQMPKTFTLRTSKEGCQHLRYDYKNPQVGRERQNYQRDGGHPLERLKVKFRRSPCARHQEDAAGVRCQRERMHEAVSDLNRDSGTTGETVPVAGTDLKVSCSSHGQRHRACETETGTVPAEQRTSSPRSLSRISCTS